MHTILSNTELYKTNVKIPGFFHTRCMEPLGFTWFSALIGK